MIHHNDDPNSKSMLSHLGRLSDIIFALAMALTILGFQLPESVQFMTNKEVNNFLLTQLKPLSNYAITFVTIAFYWIDHVQQFKYYKKTNEIHLWLYLIYLMCLFIVPYSTALTIYFPIHLWAKIWFSINIFLIGFLSLLSWIYATYKYRLVAPNLDNKVIKLMRYSALVEPLLSIVSIVLALFEQSLWDFVWYLLPIPYILINKFSKESPETLPILDLDK